ncbi:MAG: BatA domain-containing protein [Planctomycetota bacterium]
MNPAMLGLGALAVLSPILIHLLNRRRFKIVEWAAMKFLFEAEKKNRRRVRLENFILLLLRCLAMILIGLLLARPFLPSSVAELLQEAQKFERVVLLDDSLSQRVLNGNETSFELSKNSIKQMITSLADQADTEDWLTVVVTSRPDDPVIENLPVTKSTVAGLIETLDKIEYADSVANYSESLDFLRGYVASRPSGDGDQAGMNRVLYVFSDMRKRDWTADEEQGGQSEPAQLLDELADSTISSFVIDVGGTMDNNLAVTALEPLDLQVADKIIGFRAAVTNFGERTATDIRLAFQVNDAAPEYETIGSVAPGETEEILFRYVFNRPAGTPGSFGVEDDLPDFKNYRITVEIDRSSLGEQLANDQLIDDSSMLFASRVLNGTPVLLVDGHSSGISERSETHYLKALGLAGTGLEMTVGSISDLETDSLSNYSVIFVCNVDSVTSERMKTIASWVEDGGALVIMPGDQVRIPEFNRTFFNNGKGLSPLELKTVAGNALTLDSWVNFEIDPKVHPALEFIVGVDATSLSRVEIFSWFTSGYDEELVGKEFDIPMRFSDPQNSPAMVDRPYGDGRVIVFTIPGDGDWTQWPAHATFSLVMFDLLDYLVGGSPDETVVRIGGTIVHPVDLSAYSERVKLMFDAPAESVDSDSDIAATDKLMVQEDNAVPKAGEEEDSNSELYQVSFDRIDRRGFYELELTRHSGETEPVLFASNFDAAESDLERIPDELIRGDLFSSDKIRVVSTEELDQQAVEGGSTEIWPFILFLLFAVLMTEQFLGWWFGSRR